MEYVFTARRAEDMERLGRRLAGFMRAGDVVYLKGEMGSGKTTLARGIAEGRGYRRPIGSPTFTLMNIYAAEPVLYHLDFYRLKDGGEVEDLGLEDYQDGIMLIEWPETGAGAAPTATWTVAVGLTASDYDLPRRVRVRTASLSEADGEELKRDFGD